jgi:hypothetical protein
MTLRLLSVASCLLCMAAACSDDKGQASNQSNNLAASAGGNPLPRYPATAAQLTRAVDCAATFESVATLYRVIGESKSGAERDRMTRSSEDRAGAARIMAASAAEIGTELGMSQEDVRTRLLQARQRLQQESRTGDFADFAVRMGREADRCVTSMPRTP